MAHPMTTLLEATDRFAHSKAGTRKEELQTAQAKVEQARHGAAMAQPCLKSGDVSS